MKRPTEPKNMVSLFSGAMGLDLGLEAAGFKTKVVVEVNKAAVGTIKLNRPNLPVIEQSICDVTTAALLDKAGLAEHEVMLVAGGPCCQSFSTVGKRGSLSDPRGGLFKEFCRVVSDIQPRFFVMENVKGILSAAIKHRPLNQRGPGYPTLLPEEQLGSALKVILSELRALNYYVVFGLMNAADYGVPQKRWRVFFIGSRDGEDICLPSPTHVAPGHAAENESLQTWVTLRAALKDTKARRWVDFSEQRSKLLANLREGQNWRDLPVRLQREALGAAFDSWGGRSGFCRRLSWNEPAPTLTTAPDGRATTLCHPSKIRALSIEEYAALQQFPSNWELSGSLAQQYMQIGNAVPTGLGHAVGKVLTAAMRKTAKGGITQEHLKRKGLVVCGDPELESRIANRKKTQLNPARMRVNANLDEAREWMRVSTSAPKSLAAIVNHNV
jgi:DNA (cytosine-5)-methyltransferase 1